MTIKEICQQYDLRQSALARRFNIPLRTVQQWYAEDRNPPAYVPAMIKQILDLERQLDDEVLSKAFALLMEEEGRRFIEENEQLKNDPNFQVPESFHQACLDAIKRMGDET